MKNQETQIIESLRGEDQTVPISSRKKVLMDETKIMKLRTDQ